MTQGVSQERTNQRPHSGRRKEVRAKHIRKEGLTGLGKVPPQKSKRTWNLAIRTPTPKRLKELQSKGQLCGLTPTSGLGRLDPVRATVPLDYL